jgi:hypothetical protein
VVQPPLGDLPRKGLLGTSVNKNARKIMYLTSASRGLSTARLLLSFDALNNGTDGRIIDTATFAYNTRPNGARAKY